MTLNISLLVRRIKKFLPFIGLSAFYYALIILAVLLFNYTANNSYAASHHLNPWMLLVRWDSWHYLNIILKGYSGELVFFPLYPLLVWLVSLFSPLLLAGFLVSFFSLAAALYYLNRLLTETADRAAAIRTTVLLLAFPTAIFFSLIYTEALFLALTLASFYYAGRRNWLAAAASGGAAALTRNVGIFLWPVYLIFIYNARYTFNYRALGGQIRALLRTKEFWYSLIIPAGLIIFCAYGYLQSGDWLAFINGQKAWASTHIFERPDQTLWSFWQLARRGPQSSAEFYSFFRIFIIEAGSFLLLVAATIYWFRRRNWPYAVYSLLNALLFSTMFPLTSVDRYIVVIFPIFIFLAAISQKKEWRFYSLLAVFSLLFFFNIYLVSHGSWVG